MAFPVSLEDAGSLAPSAARLQAFRAARRHSRRVRVLRVFLPAAGVGAIAGLFALTQLGLPLPLGLAALRLIITPDAVIMENPKLTGFDGSDREYSVAAARAVQPMATVDQLDLETIEATINVVGQGITTITAGSGFYDHGARTLRLEGGIAVNAEAGYALRMEDADIDFLAGTMHSGKPVRVIYADSEITSERFSVTDGGGRLLFEGRVRTTIMPPKRSPDSAEPVEAAE